MVPKDEEFMSESACASARAECVKARRFVVELLFAVICGVLFSAIVYAWSTGTAVQVHAAEIQRNREDIQELKQAINDMDITMRQAIREEFAKHRENL